VLGALSSFEESEVAAVGEFVDLEEGSICLFTVPQASSHFIPKVSAGFYVPEMGMYTIIPCTLNPGEEVFFPL